jgi:hypothetical protein
MRYCENRNAFFIIGEEWTSYQCDENFNLK